MYQKRMEFGRQVRHPSLGGVGCKESTISSGDQIMYHDAIFAGIGVEYQDENTIEAKVGNKFVKGVRSSACSHTIVRSEFVNPGELLPNDKIRVRGMFGMMEYPMARILLESKSFGIHCFVDVGVMDGLSVDLILGNDIADSPVRLASVTSASPAVSQLRYSQDLRLDQTGDDELEIHRGRGMGTDRGDPLIEEGVKETPRRVDENVNRGKNSQSNFLGVGQVHLVSGTDTGLCGPMASPAVSQLRYSQDLAVDHTGGDELGIHRGRGIGTDRGDPLIEKGVNETPQRVDKIVNRENSQSNFPQSNEDSNESDESEVHQGRGMGTDIGDPLIEEGVTETPQWVDENVNRGENSQSSFPQSNDDSNESNEELSGSISSCAMGSNPSQDVLEAVDVVVGSSPIELRGKLGPKYGGNQSPGEVKVAHDVAGGEGGGVLLRIVPEGIREITRSGYMLKASKGDDAVCTSGDKAQVDEHYRGGAKCQVRAQGEKVGLLSEQSGVSGGSLTSEATNEVLIANQARVIIGNNRNEHERSREGPSSSPEKGKLLRPLGINDPLVEDTSGINKRNELLGSEFKTQFKSRDRDKGPGNTDVGAHWVVQSLHNAKGELGRNFVGRRLGFLIGVT